MSLAANLSESVINIKHIFIVNTSNSLSPFPDLQFNIPSCAASCKPPSTTVCILYCPYQDKLSSRWWAPRSPPSRPPAPIENCPDRDLEPWSDFKLEIVWSRSWCICLGTGYIWILPQYNVWRMENKLGLYDMLHSSPLATRRDQLTKTTLAATNLFFRPKYHGLLYNCDHYTILRLHVDTTFVTMSNVLGWNK